MLRELLDHSGVVDWLDEHLQDQRTQDLITHPLRAAAHADDADGLHDLRLSVSDRSPLRESDDGRPQGLASQPAVALDAQAATAPNRAVRGGSPDLGGGHGHPADAGARAPGGGGQRPSTPRGTIP